MKVLLIFLVIISSALGQQEEEAPRLDGRIVGGQNAFVENHPHQVSLQLLSIHICGGAIISDIWIITAAHCVVNAPIPSFLSVRAESSVRNFRGRVFSVMVVIVHPWYRETNLDYDIALLLLSAAIALNNARPIPLSFPGTGPEVNATAVITGWGATSEGGPASSILQVIRVPVISRVDCNRAYPSRVTDRMFCAGLLGVGGRDACQGDSGGPLVINGILYGLVSWGDGCARANAPGVYTNVPVLRAWVAMNTGV